MKDGAFLSEYSSEHFYKIQSVRREDAGDYQCYARNSVGTIVSEKVPVTVACKYQEKGHDKLRHILYSQEGRHSYHKQHPKAPRPFKVPFYDTLQMATEALHYF